MESYPNFIYGKSYMTRAGKLVKVVEMMDYGDGGYVIGDDGIARYTRRPGHVGRTVVQTDLECNTDFITSEAFQMLELCKQIALKAHEGQMYGDKPYSYHLEQVVNQMYDHETDAKMVAWLHDIIEDGHVSGKQLTELGVPEHVVEAVGLLTKMHGETYVQYINNICTNRLAMRVKEADLVANIANGPCKSLRERYIKALAVILTAEVNVMTYRG